MQNFLHSTLILLLLTGVSRSDDKNIKGKEDVSEAEKILFNQQTASAHMQELEERMFQLADMIREAEPENSARLLMALRQSRQELILEQMSAIRTMLEDKKLEQALAEQKEVLQKLNELRELLVSLDLDFRMKLEQLKQLKQAAVQLDKVIEEEGRQIDANQTLPTEAGAEQDKTFEAAATDQERNRKQADAVAEKIRSRGGAAGLPSAEQVGKASESMEGAEGEMSEKKKDGTLSKQEKAMEHLQGAEQLLKQAITKLQKELEDQVRAAVMTALVDMLKQQTTVRTATEELGPPAAKGNTRAVFGVKRLARGEERITEIAAATSELVEETGFSVTLPIMFKSFQRRTTFISQDLKNGNGGDDVVADEKGVEQDLEELLKAMEVANSGGDGNPSESCSNCGGQKNRNKMLAELMIIRMLQVRVNEETLDVDGRRGNLLDQLPPEVQGTIGSIRDHQEDVLKATADLHKQSCRSCAF